ncbi:hypothetical protein [Arthrobacter sp. C9C5]|uniref:hypothetical protein n=1 Tax=Arthrobacter sp. C9C5 TaxID=2735267 RepID=UPI001585AEF9|nr:hypothetical protein [Arthrobacter sp. C9C5]
MAELVAYARQHSAYYRDRYQGLPEHVEDVTLLPVTNKGELMARFDEVATDPAVTLAGVQEFVADPARIGHRFAGKYLVATTAGTTGTRGIFVLDDRYWSVTSGLMGILTAKWLSWWDVTRLVRRGARSAEVVATGGHFLSVAAGTREKQEKPRRHRNVRIFSVHSPLPRLVAQLNGFDPALLGGYASVLRLLATEQQAGRLHMHPVLVLSTAEGMPPAERGRLERVFGAVVREVYGCTESGYCAYGCGRAVKAYRRRVEARPEDGFRFLQTYRGHHSAPEPGSPVLKSVLRTSRGRDGVAREAPVRWVVLCRPSHMCGWKFAFHETSKAWPGSSPPQEPDPGAGKVNDNFRGTRRHGMPRARQT